jgi:hypothetical protein
VPRIEQRDREVQPGDVEVRPKFESPPEGQRRVVVLELLEQRDTDVIRPVGILAAVLGCLTGKREPQCAEDDNRKNGNGTSQHSS